MDNVLQQQYMSLATTYEIIFSFQEMFGDRSRLARQVVFKTIINTEIIEQTPMRDHMIHMIKLLNEIEILGVEIDGEIEVNMILDALMDSFK